jgi:hypothetical protein
MRFWYDTEFLEDGRTIDLISIGIVAEDGREYYAVNADAPWARVWEHTWLRDNVVPSLPTVPLEYPHPGLLRGQQVGIDWGHETVRSKKVIAEHVRKFLTAHNGPVELWGYFSAYDHVVLAQLFGPMIKLPAGLPMWTNDIQQFAAMVGFPTNRYPQQTGTAHNALDDARWTRQCWTAINDAWIEMQKEAGWPL